MNSDTRALDVLVIDNDENVHRAVLTLQLSHPHLVRHIATTDRVPERLPEAPRPDAILLDYWLGRDDVRALEALGQVLAWEVPVILYTSEERVAMLAPAVEMGVDGLCIKHDGLAALVEVLTEIRDGGQLIRQHLARTLQSLPAVRAALTSAEQRVLRGLAYGLEAPEIAERLVVSVATVRSHEKSIHAKYREALGDLRLTRQRVLLEAARDGYWDPRLSAGPLDDFT